MNKCAPCGDSILKLKYALVYIYNDGSNLKLYNNFTSRAVNTTWTTLNTHLRNNKVVNPPQIHKYEVFITSSLLSKFRCVLRRTVYNILVYYIYTTLKQ